MITPTAGDNVTVTLTSGTPVHGIVAANQNGTFTYTPKAERPGDVDVVRFAATNNVGSSSSSVTFGVLPGKDPANAVPVLSGSYDDTATPLTFTPADPRTGAVYITPSLGPATIALGISSDLLKSPDYGQLRYITGQPPFYLYTPTGLKEIGATDTMAFQFFDRTETFTDPAYATITVTDLNHRPVLTLATSAVEMYTGYRVVKITPTATDPDGETVIVEPAGYLSKQPYQNRLGKGWIYQMPLGEIHYRTPTYQDGFHYQFAKDVPSGTTTTVTFTATDSRGVQTATGTTIVKR